jgi:hypothetical protein
LYLHLYLPLSLVPLNVLNQMPNSNIHYKVITFSVIL